MKRLFCILCLLVFAKSYADEKLLYLRPIVSKSLTADQMRLIRQQMLLVSSKQTNFQMVLGEMNASRVKVNLFSIQLNITATNKKYNIKALLFNEKERKVLSRVRRNNVDSHALLRSSQVALELLFMKYKQKKTKKNNKFTKAKVTKRKNKKRSIEQLSNTRLLEKQQLDFKKRIRVLQRTVAVSEEQVSAQNENKKKQKQNKTKALQRFNKNKIASQDNLLNPGKDKTILKNNVSAGLVNRSISSRDIVQVGTSSQDIIQVRTTVQYLTAKYFGHKKFKKKSSWSYYFGGEYGKVVSKIEEDISDSFSLESGVQRSFESIDLDLFAGLELSSFSFVNVPIRGLNTQPANSNIVWFKYGMSKSFLIKKYRVGVGFDYWKSLVSSLDYSPNKNDPLLGSKIMGKVFITGLFKRNLSFLLQYGTLDLENRFVTAEASEFQLLASIDF